MRTNDPPFPSYIRVPRARHYVVNSDHGSFELLTVLASFQITPNACHADYRGGVVVRSSLADKRRIPVREAISATRSATSKKKNRSGPLTTPGQSN